MSRPERTEIDNVIRGPVTLWPLPDRTCEPHGLRTSRSGHWGSGVADTAGHTVPNSKQHRMSEVERSTHRLFTTTNATVS